MAKLTISTDLATEHLDLLEAAGFENDRDLLSASPEAIHRELVKANEILQLAGEVPSLEQVETWLATTQAGKTPAAKRAAKKSPKSPHRSKTAKTSADPTPAKQKNPASQPPDTASAPPQDEAAPPEQSITHPVNFETDPDVQEMLDRAPLALPIPNRQLAEAGIKPAEIPIAPLLNRADSDLEVHVAVGTKSRDRQAPATPKRRSSGLVQIADFHTGGKRGIDTSRVRHIEDAATDPAPPPRVDLDERTRLIRTAREKTNRGKDPKSRRFVRGVLHDRGLLVAIGCLVVVLFQISIPLAVIASPLLILSENPSGSFAWVPAWFIAFPIAVPLLAILYFSISFRVKCRVCGQRVLAPRQCLKNKKAHHIPLLGHILPLAIHTLLFKWFNCTFCGTAVRIKE